MKAEIHGKKVLVTGGTRGIGRAVTLRLANAGASVLACHRQDSDTAEKLRYQFKIIGGDHHLVKADVAREEEVDDLAAACRERFGSLDAIVCNAGTISHVPFGELSLAEWRRIIDTNLTSAYLIMNRCLPLLAGGSSVVFIGSKVATVGVPLRAHYTASKAALAGLTRSLCKELGPRGIRVNVVAPGVIETEEAVALSAEQYARYQAMTSLKRLGAPDEVADVVLFFVSDMSSYVTGTTLDVDGGA